MATTADLRNGLVIEFRDELYSVVEFQHVKPGKGVAFVRTRLKNLKTGRVIENTFRSGEKIDVVRTEEKHMQYLYPEGEHFVFMDTESYEQVHVPKEIVGDRVRYLKEGEVCDIRVKEDGEPVVFELPNFIILKITQTEPGVKGDTAAGGGKPATLETGAVVTVPFFLEIGDLIRVDTRTNTYLERAK
ncbi:MAG: elongation factor P [Candidatus Zixiibacteriota bacterium]|nr:MAG: elongation factor P [candidate division Zixibacteria bacterium]